MYLLTGNKLPWFERFYAYSVVIIKIFTDFHGIPFFFIVKEEKKIKRNIFKPKKIEPVYLNDLN